ncbi:hypothetical protein B0J14DRAFT_584172 [Halenospora varia]|nr:hypothetical protein B0J14DRAFT_584172 [Halenospora varia]
MGFPRWRLHCLRMRAASLSQFSQVFLAAHFWESFTNREHRIEHVDLRSLFLRPTVSRECLRKITSLVVEKSSSGGVVRQGKNLVGGWRKSGAAS